MNLIEGPKNSIDPLFEIISKDKQHQDIILLIDGASGKREFEYWSMAFKKMTLPETAKLLGQKEFKKEGLFKGKDPNTKHPGLLLIKSFVNNLYI